MKNVNKMWQKKMWQCITVAENTFLLTAEVKMEL